MLKSIHLALRTATPERGFGDTRTGTTGRVYLGLAGREWRCRSEEDNDPFRLGIFREDVRFEFVNCNGTPALAAYGGDHLEAVFLTDVADEKITHFYVIRNPDKLLALGAPRRISR
ncbi:hypothetical protein GCM10009678_85700 [Actinomadura kijaniata]|uniref:Uncharacterized protein n=1 Tax=Actinomadura namibiensis TaxID=182080 RepID=A0A7W3M0M8_ACTNM|nr:hypothetical protein [Actinomadura namibiensis]MBA8957683.1 hypothetical protein [Actinomadura namibiensis]